MSPAAGKICVVCGKDCAGLPRVKDPRGRYYCKPCYDQAAERKKAAKEAAVRQTQDDIDDLDIDDPDMIDFEKPLFADEEDAFDEGSPGTDQKTRPCPECGSELEAGAILCINCGYNVKEGRVIKPKVVSSDDEPEEGGSAAKWPIVIGVVSLVFAVFGVMGYGLAFASAVVTPIEEVGFVVWGGGLFLWIAMLALSIGLGIAAIALLKERKMAVHWLRWWAWSKAGASVVLSGFAGYSLLAVVSAETETRIPAEFMALGAAMIMLSVFLALLWMLCWPVLILLWLRREKIKAQVAEWQ